MSPEDSPDSSVLQLPDDLLRKILNQLDLKDKLQASQVCRDFRRILALEVDPDSLGEITFDFDASDDLDEPFENDPSSPDLIRVSLKHPLATRQVQAFLKGPRGRGLTCVHLRLLIETTAHDNDDLLEMARTAHHLFASQCVSALSDSVHFKGQLKLSTSRSTTPGALLDFIDIVRLAASPDLLRRTKLQLFLDEIAEEELEEAMDTVMLALDNGPAIYWIELPPVPGFTYSVRKSSANPPPFEVFCLGPAWSVMEDEYPLNRMPHIAAGGAMSVTCLAGLNIQDLYWVPPVSDPECWPAEPLRGLSASLKTLSLSRVYPEAWEAVNKSLPVLTRLTSLLINAYDPMENGGLELTDELEADGSKRRVNSPLYRLAPLSIPSSLEALDLWYSLPPLCEGLTIDALAGCTPVKTLSVGVRRDGPSGRQLPCTVRLGASLGALAGLAELQIHCLMSLKNEALVELPPAFSSLGHLDSFSVRNALRVDIPRYPRHWSLEGLRLTTRNAEGAVLYRGRKDQKAGTAQAPAPSSTAAV